MPTIKSDRLSRLAFAGWLLGAAMTVAACVGSALSGPDASVIVPGQHIQIEYLDRYALDQAGILDCDWFEDGSATCR